MLVLHAHPQTFFGKSFKAAYDTRKHGDCRFVLLAKMLCVSNVMIFPYQKKNCMGIKWYVLNLGTTTFDEREILESVTEERCWCDWLVILMVKYKLGGNVFWFRMALFKRLAQF